MTDALVSSLLPLTRLALLINVLANTISVCHHLVSLTHLSCRSREAPVYHLGLYREKVTLHPVECWQIHAFGAQCTHVST